MHRSGTAEGAAQTSDAGFYISKIDISGNWLDLQVFVDYHTHMTDS